VHFKPFRLFSREGEITNDSIINRYVNEFRVHFFSPGDHFSNPYFQEFSFINEDSVLNISKAPIVEARRTLTGVYDLFKSRSNIFLNDTNDIHFALMTHKTFHTREPAGGIKYFEWESPVYVMKRQNDSLFLAMSKYIIVSRRDYITSFRSDFFNNVLKDEGVKSLGPTDTLLIQVFDLAMIKGSE